MLAYHNHKFEFGKFVPTYKDAFIRPGKVPSVFCGCGSSEQLNRCVEGFSTLARTR